MQMLVTVTMSVILVAVSLIINYMLISSSNDSMKRQISGLVASNTHQMELNIDSYFKKVEKVAALLFSDETYYAYDATQPPSEQYDKIQAEDTINEKIVDLGLMENFSDFGIIYANDETIGWISQTTQAEFTDGGIYDEFSGVIRDSEKESGWSYGIKDNYDRIYYVQRLNPNAVAMVSFYTSELGNVINVPDELSDMMVRMVDQDNRIIYSTNDQEISGELPEEISGLLNGKTGISVFNQDYLVISHKLANDWSLVCSVPSDRMLAVSQESQRNSQFIIFAIVVLGLVITFAISQRLNRSMNGVVENLSDMAENDLMTGLLNKTAFMNAVEEDLEKGKEAQATCFLMFDLDNFKQVNDNQGHSTGDKVLIHLAESMRKAFSDEPKMILGRLGGDEFAAYVSYGNKDRKQAKDYLDKATDALYRTFAGKTDYVDREIRLGISMGILIEGPGQYKAEELYKNVDSALYVSKRNGKNQKTFV